MRTTRQGSAVRAAALAFVAATTPAACTDGAALDARLGPGASGGTSAVGGSALARGASDLVGSWTRITPGANGLLTQTTFTFLAGGQGARTIVVRSLTGASIVTDQQTFAWQAGGGILALTLRDAATGLETPLRASYAITVGLTGATLRLDGQEYGRTD